jgi:hypothetical protein
MGGTVPAREVQQPTTEARCLQPAKPFRGIATHLQVGNDGSLQPVNDTQGLADAYALSDGHFSLELEPCTRLQQFIVVLASPVHSTSGWVDAHAIADHRLHMSAHDGQVCDEQMALGAFLGFAPIFIRCGAPKRP